MMEKVVRVLIYGDEFSLTDGKSVAGTTEAVPFMASKFHRTRFYPY